MYEHSSTRSLVRLADKTANLFVWQIPQRAYDTSTFIYKPVKVDVLNHKDF